MDNVFLFKIANNTLYIDKIGNTKSRKDLVFSLSYIRENLSLVSAVLNVSIVNNNVDTCVINTKYNIIDLIRIINDNVNIKKIILKENFTVTSELFNIINKNDHLQKFECYKIDRKCFRNLSSNTDYFTRYRNIFIKRLSKIVSVFVVIATVLFSYSIFNEYKEVKSINDNLDELVDIKKEYTIKVSEISDSSNPKTGDSYNSNSNYYTNYTKVFDKLVKINSDTVGWITINNTKIDYPVVQSTNNDYYLNKDFKRENNSKGWIFMDYRNNPNNLDSNTIIYGHNIVSSGIMFADVVKLFDSNYYNNNDNNYITFNTKDNNMVWKIFSVYKTDDNVDYLKTNFKADEDFQAFIDNIKNKSEISFNVDTKVNTNTKILTLSTCHSNNSRYVVHAFLQ